MFPCVQLFPDWYASYACLTKIGTGLSRVQRMRVLCYQTAEDFFCGGILKSFVRLF